MRKLSHDELQDYMGCLIPREWTGLLYSKDDWESFHGWNGYVPQLHVLNEKGETMFEVSLDDTQSLYINATKEYFVAPMKDNYKRFMEVVTVKEYQITVIFTDSDYNRCYEVFELHKLYNY